MVVVLGPNWLNYEETRIRSWWQGPNGLRSALWGKSLPPCRLSR